MLLVQLDRWIGANPQDAAAIGLIIAVVVIYGKIAYNAAIAEK